eukprot:356191-Chlamydomonas_euryale.AAC.12
MLATLEGYAVVHSRKKDDVKRKNMQQTWPSSEVAPRKFVVGDGAGLVSPACSHPCPNQGDG